MPSFTITAEDKNLRRHRVFVADDLHLVRSELKPGYWMMTSYAEASATNALTSNHLFVSGRFTETTGTIPDYVPGDITSKKTAVIEPGDYRRETPEGCEMWCIRNHINPQAGVGHSEIYKLAVNETFEVEQGHNFFILEGSCLNDDLELTTQKLYRCKTKAVAITADEVSYILVWPTPI